MEFVFRTLGVKGTWKSGLFTQGKKNIYILQRKRSSFRILSQGQRHLHNMFGIKKHNFNTENGGDTQ